MSRGNGNDFCGMLIIRKEQGYTSSDVVSKLRGILHMRKIGHTGTLDPMAEGVLPVCLGSATKAAELIADRDKEYIAGLRLGVTTDTQDITGTVLTQRPDHEVREILLQREGDARDGEEETRPGPEEEGERIYHRILDAASGFTGQIRQLPPMFSAVHAGGQRLYELARRGITVERSPRTVTIYELEILSVALPVVTMRVVCSRGTYIRTLCEDLGDALGTGGTMASLLRTRVGCFTLEQALTLGEVAQLMRQSFPEGTGQTRDDADVTSGVLAPTDNGRTDARKPSSGWHERSGGEENGTGIESRIIAVDRLFSDAPAVHVRDGRLRLLQNGNPLSASDMAEGRLPRQERIRVYDERGTFYALYRYDEGRGHIMPLKMFHETVPERHSS